MEESEFVLELTTDEMILLTLLLGRASGEGYDLYSRMLGAVEEAGYAKKGDTLKDNGRYEVVSGRIEIHDLRREN